MTSSLRRILSLLLSTVFIFASIGLLNLLVPLRGAEAGFSGTLLGGLSSAYYAGFLVGTFVFPPLVARIGHIRAFAFATSAAAIIVLLHTLGTVPWAWLTLRFLQGIVMVGIYTIIESWLNASADNDKRGTVFGVYMMVNLTAIAFSQQFMRFDNDAYLLFILVTILACAAAIPVVVTRLAQPEHQSAPRLQLSRLFKTTPTAGVSAALNGLAIGALFGLAPIYALRVGFDTASISTYMMIGILGGAALQWPLGHWSDTVDRRLAIMEISLLACVMSLLMWVSGNNQWATSIFFFIFSGLAFAVYPMAIAHAVDYLSKKELVGASSTLYLVYGAGSATGPLVAGVLMSQFGPAALMVWFAGIHAVLAMYTFYRYRVFRRHEVDANNFRILVRTSTMPLDVDVDSDTHADDATDDDIVEASDAEVDEDIEAAVDPHESALAS